MPVVREYEPVERPLKRSTWNLYYGTRLECKYVDDHLYRRGAIVTRSAARYVSVVGEGLDKTPSAIFANKPESVDDAITWAEDFLTMLRRLKE